MPALPMLVHFAQARRHTDCCLQLSQGQTSAAVADHIVVLSHCRHGSGSLWNIWFRWRLALGGIEVVDADEELFGFRDQDASEQMHVTSERGNLPALLFLAFTCLSKAVRVIGGAGEVDIHFGLGDLGVVTSVRSHLAPPVK